MKKLDRQRGAVLLTSLMLLLVLTLLGLSAMQSTSLEERMAGNARHSNVAFQAAEAGLRGAEAWMSGLTAQPDASATGSGGVWTLDGPDADDTDTLAWWRDWDDSDWDGANVSVYGRTLSMTSSVNLDDVPPRYVVEERQYVRDSLNLGNQADLRSGRTFYQITSRGTDLSGRMQVLVRSTYARRF